MSRLLLALDIGHGVEVTPVLRDGIFVGILWSHPSAKAPTGRCDGGMVPFAGRSAAAGGTGWDLISETPLSLAPSLRCTACGCHGYIRYGAWLPA